MSRFTLVAVLSHIILFLFPIQLASASTLQNTHARKNLTLDGEWNIIVDPYENGFYNHRYEENKHGYFKNAKMKNPSDLVEYNFATSETLHVPGAHGVKTTHAKPFSGPKNWVVILYALLITLITKTC